MSTIMLEKLAVVGVLLAALGWFLVHDLKRVRIVFKGGHVERLWLKNLIITNTPNGGISKMEWVRHCLSRKRMFDINLSEIAAVFIRS